MTKQRRSENYHGRPDWRTGAIVDAAIELTNRSNMRAAALFLQSQAVPLNIALRVLTRRQSRQ